MNPEHRGACDELHEHLPCDAWDATLAGCMWRLNEQITEVVGMTVAQLEKGLIPLSEAMRALYSEPDSCACEWVDVTGYGDTQKQVLRDPSGCALHDGDDTGIGEALPILDTPPLGVDDFADVRRALGTE